MIRKRIFLILFLPFLLAGCALSFNSQEESAGNFGGLFRTSDGGETWQQVTNVYTVGGQVLNFNNANVTSLALDPMDPAAIYLGTQLDGIFFSYNYGNAWHNTLSGKGTVNDIVVDPEDNCTIFAAVHNSIYKTIDCARTWKEVYFETRAGQYITALAISVSDDRILYAGTSGGSILKSQDNGYSWDVVNRLESDVKKILIQNHTDDRIVYVATKNNGVFKSEDAGLSWEDLMELPVDKAEEEEDELSLFRRMHSSGISLDLNSDSTKFDSIIYVNKIGIFRLDSDEVWRQIKLLTPNNKEVIYSAVVNPTNGDEIYYGTSAAIYHTIDGGVNWDIKKLPTTHSARVLKFSLDNKFLYLGAYQIKQ